MLCKKILFCLSLWSLLVFSPLNYGVAQSVTISSKQYQILKQEILKHEQNYKKLKVQLAIISRNSKQEKKEILAQKEQLASATQSLTMASGLLDEQNKSLQKLTKQIKDERKKQKIENAKYLLYGALLMMIVKK